MSDRTSPATSRVGTGRRPPRVEGRLHGRLSEGQFHGLPRSRGPVPGRGTSRSPSCWFLRFSAVAGHDLAQAVDRSLLNNARLPSPPVSGATEPSQGPQALRLGGDVGAGSGRSPPLCVHLRHRTAGVFPFPARNPRASHPPPQLHPKERRRARVGAERRAGRARSIVSVSSGECMPPACPGKRRTGVRSTARAKITGLRYSRRFVFSRGMLVACTPRS